MSLQLIIGAGPVGRSTALELAAQGHEVRLVTRTGTGPLHPSIERITCDASELGALVPHATGASAIYNCANPPYHRWTTEWPPLAAAVLAAAESTGAVLVLMGNLYGYGPVDHPMTEDDPLRATSVKGSLRARMWNDVLAAHTAGRVRATEARASDFFGPGATNSHLGEQMVPPVLRGKTARVVGNPDVLHSWSYIPDIARALAVLGTDERAWGRPWHVPTAPPRSQHSVLDQMAARAGAPPARLKPLPGWMLRAAGVFQPMTRELIEIAYQFESPFIIDSTAFETQFGLSATPFDESIDATTDWWQQQFQKAA
jgi:nucleoside-diphosphate-sugar epimerase